MKENPCNVGVHLESLDSWISFKLDMTDTLWTVGYLSNLT